MHDPTSETTTSQACSRPSDDDLAIRVGFAAYWRFSNQIDEQIDSLVAQWAFVSRHEAVPVVPLPARR
ncbi:MAG: hypothetical protein ACOY3P_16205 [Planctomycetota bacterium]